MSFSDLLPNRKDGPMKRSLVVPLARSNIICAIIAAFCACVLSLANLLVAPIHIESRAFADTASQSSTLQTVAPPNEQAATTYEKGDSEQPKDFPQTAPINPDASETVDKNGLVASEKEEEDQSPTDPSEPMEKGLAFHASDTSPHLTAFFDGKETAQSGWVLHEGFWYWFNKSPYATENSWVKTGGSWYYLDETGKMKTGTFSDGNRTYLSDPSGRMLSNGWHRSGGVWYWLEASGAAKTGWLRDGGAWYWLDPESGAMATGWYRDGAAWYYSDGSGAMLANRWLKQGGTWYYLNPSGSMRTGWLYDGGSWYWLDPESGAMATGFVDDGGTAYYCDGSGRMAANRWINESGTWYALSKSGAVRTGWFQEGSARYWLDPQTGAMAVGERIIDGRQYFFSSSGAMVNNVWVSLGDGTCGFIDASGEVVLVGEYDDQNRIVCLDGQAGWRTAGGKLFYFDPEDKGVLRTGWFEVDGLRYYADASGIKQVGWVSVSGTWYYLDSSNGVMKTGWICVDGTWYYLEPMTGAMQTGWLHENGEWYYLKNSGAMTANSSVRISDGTYWYMNGSGRHDRQAGIDIIMRTARSLLGVPYVWLGVYPQDGGMDCASFTWYLYKQLGIDIGFETYDQMHSGVRVFGDAQPGDIILMYYGAWPNYNPILPEHVVLYAGGGMIYEEPTFGGRCQYVSLASKGASTTTVQRILS